MASSGYAAQQASRRGYLLLLVVVLGVLGTADGAYLTLVHIDYELGKPSELAEVCKGLASQGCSVTAGRFGAFWGIPVALIGLGGATATAVTAMVAWARRAEPHDAWRNVVFALAVTSVLASITMGTLSTIEGSYCPFCVAWYGINLGLFLAAWLALGDEQDSALGRVLGDAMGPPGLAAIAAFFLSVSAGLWLYGDRRDEILYEREMVLDAIVAEKIMQPQVEIDLRGLPTKGPEDAAITIVEIADFQCPFCRRLWESVGEYQEHGPRSVRVAFVHYPLDDQCNPGVERVHEHACLAAKAAECARQQEKFFEYGDVLFKNQAALEREDLLRYAGDMGLDDGAFATCLDGEDATLEVRRSIARAILLKVGATPTFFVNGYMFKGALPKPLFPLIMDKLAAKLETRAQAPAE